MSLLTVSKVSNAVAPKAPPLTEPRDDIELNSVDMPATASQTSSNVVFLADVEHATVADDPRAWSSTRKGYVFMVISLSGFATYAASSIFFPALPELQVDLRATSSQVALVASLYELLQGTLPPILWAPLSETFGRKACALVSGVVFIAASAGCALAPAIGPLVALRVLQSMGASSASTLATASLADMYDPHERGRKLGFYYAAPLLAQSAAPLIGGGLTEASSWRAVFYFCVALSAFTFAAQVPAPEPFRKERSMAWRAAEQRAKEAEAKRQAESTVADTMPSPRPGLLGRSTKTAGRKLAFRDLNPLSALGQIVRQPNNVLLSVFTALLFANTYCLLYTGGIVFAEAPYSYSPLRVGCVLLSYGGGNVVGSVLGGRYSDAVYAKLKAANDGRGEPEMRIRATYPTLLTLPPLLLAFAWLVDRGQHIALVCLVFLSTGVSSLWAYSSLLAYVVDANPGRASSASAFNSACRGTSACVASQLTDVLLVRMGHGWLYTGWAAAMIVGAASLLVVERHGKRWRERRRA